MSNRTNTIIVDKLKNGFLISPRINQQIVPYDECIFIEGYDLKKLAEALASMFETEVTFSDGEK